MRWARSMCLALLFLFAAGASVHAQSDRIAQDIERANRALDAGEYAEAQVSVNKLLQRTPPINRAQRGEAFRILGLVHFFQGELAEARSAFLEYLRTDPDAHLDPALVPPEAVSLLEDVRARNSAGLDAYRKKPRRKRYLLLNLVPTAGQFQNGESTKGFLLAGGLGLLLSANVASYVLFKRYCDSVDRTCSSGGEDKTSTARGLQTANILTGVGLISLYAYSVVDGWLGYRRIQRQERQERDRYMSLHVLPSRDGASFAWSLRF